MRGILAVVLATWSFGAATWSLGAQARPTLVLTCDPASCALKPGEPGEVLQLGDDGKYHWVKTAPTSIPDCSASHPADRPTPPLSRSGLSCSLACRSGASCAN